MDVFIFTENAVFVQVADFEDGAAKGAFLADFNEVFGHAVFLACRSKRFDASLGVVPLPCESLHCNEVTIALHSNFTSMFCAA